MNKAIAIIQLFLFLTFSAYGNSHDSIPKRKNPTFVQLQYAGNMGLVSAGIGKSFFSERLSTCFIYGYLPENINDVSVHSFALKTYYTAIRKSICPKANLEGYLGFSLIRGITKNTYIKFPSHYPDGYYPPNAFHLALFTGARHTAILKSSKWFDKISIFAEIGTIDYKIWYDHENDSIDFDEIWNLSFGVALNIQNQKK